MGQLTFCSPCGLFMTRQAILSGTPSNPVNGRRPMYSRLTVGQSIRPVVPISEAYSTPVKSELCKLDLAPSRFEIRITVHFRMLLKALLVRRTSRAKQLSRSTHLRV